MAQTHFGYQTVDEPDKAARVRGVFDSVAQRYDVMNDLMSFGLHRAWKAYTVAVANVRAGDKVLDIAGGTGDLARAFARKASARRAWWCTPTSMKRCCASGATACSTKAWRCPRVTCDAEHLPFADGSSTWSAWPSACAT
jgi:demethylmenaquinone methyltransferase/2-methoxy-6-polyprenyl-1,4-benzoquinol methylase